MNQHFNTERKLAEAKFFLDQLNPSRPYFDYILSAYLNASRSTTWIMRNEFEKIDGWEQWFRNANITHNDKSLLTRINELRIKSVKTSGIKTEYRLLDHIVIEESYYESIENALIELEGEEVELVIGGLSEEALDDDIRPDVFHFRGKVDMKDPSLELERELLLSICTSYYDFLKNQVETCVSKFGKQK
ncbi:MAG: hypothetical protein KA010_04415 [Saprospiraceae bacterium]|nr:hypothetical protein [Saprospiraceae bacterium]